MAITCDCSIDYDACDCAFISQRMRTARVQHICCECGGTITPGARYEHTWGRWDGSFGTYKTCEPCKHIRDNYCRSGYYFGNLRERLLECLGFDYTKVPIGDNEPCKEAV